MSLSPVPIYPPVFYLTRLTAPEAAAVFTLQHGQAPAHCTSYTTPQIITLPQLPGEADPVRLVTIPPITLLGPVPLAPATPAPQPAL